jgi:hypothetical protein
VCLFISLLGFSASRICQKIPLVLLGLVPSPFFSGFVVRDKTQRVACVLFRRRSGKASISSRPHVAHGERATLLHILSSFPLISVSSIGLMNDLFDLGFANCHSGSIPIRRKYRVRVAAMLRINTKNLGHRPTSWQT